MFSYQFARGVCLFSYLGLYCVYGLWSLWFGPAQLAASIVLWLLVCSGLLVVLPGVLRGKRRSYQWLCFILLIYFIYAVLDLFTLAALESSVWQRYVVAYSRMLFVVAGFVAGMFAVRWHPGTTK